MRKISVIIPVYNAASYLERCLDSLVNQTLSDIEIIAVNDGSTDKSGEILDCYQTKYPDKIQVITKENGGMSDARNAGLEKATGEYIAFVDSDDYVDVTMLEKMYQKAKEKDFDMVTCDTMVKYPKETKKVLSGVQSDKENLTIEEKKDLLFGIYTVVWNKIYKREHLAEKFRFKKDVWYEDVLYLYSMIPSLTSIGVVCEPLYYYIQNEKSVTYTYNKKLYDLITVCDCLLEFYQQNQIEDTYQDVLEYIYVRYLFATFIKRLSKAKEKEKFDQGVEYVLKKVNENFPNYKQNRYIKMVKPKSLYLRFFNKQIANLIYRKEKNKMN